MGRLGLASAGEEQEGVESYHSDSSYFEEHSDSDVEPPPVEVAGDDMPGLESDVEASESDGEPTFGRQQRAQQQRAQPQQRTQQQQRAPSKTAPAAAAAAPAGKKAAAKPKPKPKEPQAQFQTEPPPLPEGLVSTLISSSSYVVPMDPMAPAGKKAAKPKPKPKKVPGDDTGDIPGLLSDAASSDAGSSGDEDDFRKPPLPGWRHVRGSRAQAEGAAAKAGAGSFSTGYFATGAAGERSGTAYGGAGAGRKEDLRGPQPGSGGASRPTEQFEAAQQAAAQRARQRKAASAAPVVVEKVEAQVAQDEKIREALRLEEEERKALRKKMGLEEDEEAEVEDPVLGPCSYGEQCNKDPEAHAVKTSHTNRYEFRCSAGHKLFYHRECWLKATVRWVDLKGQEHEKEGRDFKFNSYKKEHRRKCIQPGCEGIVTFIEGPSKYGILNIEEEVRKEQAGQEAAAEELPEWELYKQQEPAPQPPKRNARHSLDESTPAAQRTQREQRAGQAEAGDAGTSAPVAEESEEPSNPTPALPDDMMLRAFKRESSEDELLGLAKARKGKEKGKPAAKDVADIAYEDGAGGKKKKGKGIKLVLDTGLSIAEQRRLQHQQARRAVCCWGRRDVAVLGRHLCLRKTAASEIFEPAAAGNWDMPDTSQRPQRLADSLLEFPDLQEAAELAKEKREEDEERAGRQLYSAALLGALRSFRAEADDLRPDDPHGPSTVLVENLDYKKIRDDEGTRPEMFLRSTFAEYGPVKDLRMYEACRAAAVSFRSTAAAYKAFVLLPQKTLLHSRLAASMLKKWPKEQEVEDLAQAMLAEDQRRAEEGAWEEEEAATTGSLSSAAGPHEDRPSSSASGGRAPLFMERGRVSPAGMPSMSITIPGSAAATAAASAGASGGFAGPGSGGVGAAGSSLGRILGGSLKVNAREFVPGGFASPGLAVSPPTGSAAATAAAAAAAANAAAGLRVAAHEFRPGGPAAGAAGAAAAGAAAAAHAEAEDPLLGQFLSGPLIQASTQTLGVYLSMGDDQFGIQTMYLERVGVITTGHGPAAYSFANF
ncbi:hypothetical protein COHA_007106 [Chlorella ohadii]|uniref:Uncharacterized protein n=1 Tax=Chlorella ohadii TaxID=2649997 RepID=A0AAD5DMX7_9CHLO|nr:hypothetical protein COHA_007106 [Chlorella ohadii]